MKTEQTGPMMTRQTRPASLALRVTAFVGIATILVFFAFGQIVVHSLEQHFAEIDAGELGIVAESVQNVLQQPASGSTLEARLAGAVVGHHGMYFQVLAASGARLYSSPGMDLSEPAGQLKPVAHIAANTLDVWEQGGKRYRGAVLRIATGAATGAADVTPLHGRGGDRHRHASSLHRQLSTDIVADHRSRVRHRIARCLARGLARPCADTPYQRKNARHHFHTIAHQTGTGRSADRARRTGRVIQ
jgi:hypothetical protein